MWRCSAAARERYCLMAEKTFRFELITPDRVALSDDRVVSLVAPGVMGYIGILANHAALATELGIGELDIRRADGSVEAVAVAGGFMEVFENTVTVLADCAELACEIDVERAEEALHRAEERLASHAPEVDIDRAHLALARAMNRLRVARRRSLQ